ncbi:MAG: hypothetical protein HQK54_12940, partial [Oligoflexales bacterium]|nr:hypothetical protein [Oligoflexales bacterium]
FFAFAGLFGISKAAMKEVAGKKYAGLLGKIPVSAMPAFDAYRVLADEPDGMVLELPFNHPLVANPESDYGYYLSRVVHKKQILNGGVSYNGDLGITISRLARSLHLNEPDGDIAKRLRSIGVRYLVVHKDKFDTGRIFGAEGLSKIASDSTVDIFRISGVEGFDHEKFRRIVWPKEFVIDVGELGSDVWDIRVTGADVSQSGSVRHLNYKGIGGVLMSKGPGFPLESGEYSLSLRLGAKGPRTGSGNGDLFRIRAVNGKSVIGERLIKESEIDPKGLAEFRIDFLLERAACLDVEITLHRTGEYYQSGLVIRRVNRDGSYRIGKI